MNETEKTYDEQHKNNERDAKQHIIIGWGIYLSSLILVFTYFVAFIWALIKRTGSETDFEKSHYNSMISMFILSFIFNIVGFGMLVWGYMPENSGDVSTNLTLILSSLGIMGATYVWNVIRMLKGLSLASDLKSY
jgi:uncharacterized membrane protein